MPTRPLRRILVSRPLPFREAVFIADAGHQVLEACDPRPSLFPAGRDQVEGLHVVSVVDAEATVGVEAAVCVALEDLRLFALTHLLDRIYRNWVGEGWVERRIKKLYEVAPYNGAAFGRKTSSQKG